MIVNSLKKTFKTMILKPQVFFPMLIVTIIAMTSENLTTFVLEKPLTEMIYFADVFMTSDIMSFFFTRYWFEILILLASGFFVLFATSVAFIAIANFVKKKDIIESINSSVIELRKSLSLSFFVFVTSFILFVLFQIFLNILTIVYSFLPQEINFFLQLFIIPIILIGIILIILTKLVFVIPALIESNLKQALKNSWNFTNDKFWNALFFLIIILSIISIFLFLITAVGILFEIDFVLIPVSEILATTFLGLTIAHYFFE